MTSRMFVTVAVALVLAPAFVHATATEASEHGTHMIPGKKVLIASAVRPLPCESGLGSYIDVLALSNKADYAQMHGYGLYLNIKHGAILHGPWNKVHVMQHLLATADREQYEWIAWIDSDALFSNMTMEFPLERFEGFDIVVPYATMEEVFEVGDAMSLNTGLLMLRNNDWSKDLMGELGKYGVDWWHTPDHPMRDVVEQGIQHFHQGLFDQAGLAYVLYKDRKIHESHFWNEYNDLMYMDNQMVYWWEKNPDPDSRPLMLHWAGCSFCSPRFSERDVRECHEGFVEQYSRSSEAASAVLHDGQPFQVKELLRYMEPGVVTAMEQQERWKKELADKSKDKDKDDDEGPTPQQQHH